MPEEFTTTPAAEWDSPSITVNRCSLCGEAAYGARICLECWDVLSVIQHADMPR